MSSEVLLDRYQIDSLLATRVGERSLKALDRHLDRPVFIREYDLSHPLNQERLGRFQRQASLLKQVSHPRIPTLLDAVETHTHFVLISQYVPGENLAQKQADGWQPLEADCLPIAEQLLQILSYLQRYNPPVLTFDLRPAKLIMDGFERVWIADFGGLQPVNALYSLGATLIQLLTGRELKTLPRSMDRPAYHSFVTISNEFARWLDILLEPNEKKGFGSADKALEVLWKLQGKSWQTPIAPTPHRSPTAPLTQLTPLTPLIPEQQSPWPLETLLAEQYRLSQFLGKGQGTWKFAGQDLVTKQDVVLKIMPLPPGVDAAEPYREQAISLQSLHHPQIPRLLNAFELPYQGQAYWVMASMFIAGQPLKDKYEAGWRPVSAELWDITRQILKILDFLHTRQPPRGHGNLNPSNLVVNNFGRIWLVDFGLLPAEPLADLYDLASSLIFLLSGSQPGEFLAANQSFRFADGIECPQAVKTWLRVLLRAEPGQLLDSAARALKAFEQALLPEGKTELKPESQPESKTESKAPKLKLLTKPVESSEDLWPATTIALEGLGLRCQLQPGGGLALECPESKELAQWGRSKTIGLLFSPLRLLEDSQEKSRQGSKLFPLSGHRLEINPTGIRLLKGESASKEKEILTQNWNELIQVRLTPAPARLLAALKDKMPSPAGTNFRLFHLVLTNKALNYHCLLFLPPKAIPPLTRLIRQLTKED